MKDDQIHTLVFLLFAGMLVALVASMVVADQHERDACTSTGGRVEEVHGARISTAGSWVCVHPAD
jgi:hypothetical protein